MVGSPWIDGPTLNRCNRHQGVILDIALRGRCITRQLSRTGRTSRYGRTYQTLGVCSTDLGTYPGAMIRAMRDQRWQIIGPTARGDTATPPCSSLQHPPAYKYPVLQPPTQRAYRG
jgi:hypothetical protein